jgi:hypothetical protein
MRGPPGRASRTVILVWYLQSHYMGFWRRFDPAVMRRQLSYALPIGFGAILLSVETDLHNYLVLRLLGL